MIELVVLLQYFFLKEQNYYSAGVIIKASHSGSNLASNIAHFKNFLLMWQVINERW